MAVLNFDYLRLYQEFPLLIKLKIKEIWNKEVKDCKRILIINTSTIGDFILSLPAMHSFIKENSASKIDLAVSAQLKSLAKKIRGINEVYEVKPILIKEGYPKDKKNILPKSEYDFIMVMRISKDAYGLIRKVKYKRLKSYLWPFLKFTISLIKNNSFGGKLKQWKEVNFEIINKKINKKNKEVKFEDIFNFSKEDYERIKKLPVMQSSLKKIIIHTGAKWSPYLWENEKWIELIKKINKLENFKFIFVGGADKEEKDFEVIQDNLNFKIYSLIKKVNILELLLIMRMSNYFIGIDSGPRNMAHIADLRSISLLGPGPKIFMPLSKKDKVIDKSNCHCTTFYCFKKKNCLQRISVEEVFEEFKNLRRSSKR